MAAAARAVGISDSVLSYAITVTCVMQMLAAVDVDRVQPALTAAQKLAHFVKITMLFLEEENAVDAERFFVKVPSDVLALNDLACGPTVQMHPLGL